MSLPSLPVAQKDVSPWMAMRLAFEIGYIIALPIVIFALSGRLLDRYLGTSPLFFLAGIGLAMVSTSVWLVQKTRSFLKQLEQDAGAPPSTSEQKGDAPSPDFPNVP